MKRNPVGETRGGQWYYPKPVPSVSVQSTWDVKTSFNGIRLACDERLEAWRGSSHSDDGVIIKRNMARAYMDPKGFTKVFLGFRLALDDEEQT
jgi:hypothetical protein